MAGIAGIPGMNLPRDAQEFRSVRFRGTSFFADRERVKGAAVSPAREERAVTIPVL
jgi:hypothetical protein